MIGATTYRSHMQRLGRLAVRPRRLNAPTFRFLSSQNQAPEDKAAQPSGHVETSTDEVEIYKKSQGFTVRVMCGISMVNLMYWSSIIFNHYFFDGMVVQGIDLAGDPMWGYVGSFCTGGFLFFTKYFANHAIYRAHLSDKGKRMGIQVHTMFGTPGKKYEFATGDAEFVSKKQQSELAAELSNAQQTVSNAKVPSLVARLIDSSFFPIRVKGISGNCIVDKSAMVDYDQRLFELLSKGQDAKLEIESRERKELLESQQLSRHRKKSKSKK